VILFLHDASVELLLQRTILTPQIIKLTSDLSNVSLRSLLNVLQIEQQDFLGFLVLSRLVSLRNLGQIVVLLVEQSLGILHSVEQVEVLAVFIRLEIE
jgi:hypothetical protein